MTSLPQNAVPFARAAACLEQVNVRPTLVNIARAGQEIGTLRALGFRRKSVLTAFLVESILLAFIGGLAGLGLASLMSFVRISTLNFGTFAELAFGFVLSPEIVFRSMLFSLIMGVVGGFLPAVRASRMNILTALRSA